MLGHCGICIFLQEVVFLEVKLLQFPFERDFVDRNFQATFDVNAFCLGTDPGWSSGQCGVCNIYIFYLALYEEVGFRFKLLDVLTTL